VVAGVALAMLTVAPATATEAYAGPGQLAPQTHDATTPGVDRAYGRLPLAFMRQGRSYTARTASGSIALRRGVATIIPSQGKRIGDPVTVGLAGAAVVDPRVQQRLPGVVNDLRGDDPRRWRTDIPTFGRVRYAGVYPGIDLDYHGTSGTLEYDFRLAPGADPGRIAVDFHGAPLRLTRAGALVAGRGADRLRQAPPVAFQPSADGRDPVPARFVVRGDHVGFELGAYDPARPLVIDPLVLSFATLLGGVDEDLVNDVAVDSAGATYLAGYTLSNNFPTTSGAYDTTLEGIDAIVTKINPAGSALVYSTLLGGSATDFADTVAVDSAGNAFVAGETLSISPSTTTKFPTTAGAYTNVSNDPGFGDAFVTKLNAAGNGLVYSSVYGGSNQEEVRAIALDASGAAYVGGYTASTSNATTAFPTAGAYQALPGGSNRDGFVTKLNGSGARVYSTYLGGSGQDEVNGIDVDSLGRAYVTGFATAFSGNNFPTTPANRFAPVEDNGADAFLSRLSASGASLDYSTGIGTDGNGNSNDGTDYAYAVAVGPTDGIAYITGTSRTSGTPSNADFPLKHQYEGRDGGCCFGQDVFVSKFDTTLAGNASLLYSTLVGGSGAEAATAIDVDSAGNAYIGGVVSAFSSGSPYDTTPDELGGGVNRGSAFVTKLVQSGNTNASLGFSTTIQGTVSLDSVGGVVYDEAAGAVYAGGTSRNGLVLTTAGAYQTTGAGGRDGFAVKISVSSDSTPPQTTITGGPLNGATVTSNPVGFTFSASETSTFECSYDGAPYAACSSPGPGLTGSDSRTLTEGAHAFSVRASDTAGNVDASPDSRSFTVALADSTPPDTSITSGPANGSTVTTSSVTFGFSSTEGASTFECSTDGQAFAACTSPGPASTGSDTRMLTNGPHTFAVRARDAATNVDASPATRSFTLNVPAPPPADTTPPDTTITKAPPRTVKVKRSATVKVEFTSTEPGSTFTCKVDEGPVRSCRSAETFRLGKGRHTISITATDAAGNTDASPATVRVTVKKKKPKPAGKH
jgi:Beta-propeller repeat